jgi:hypothetical protein
VRALIAAGLLLALGAPASAQEDDATPIKRSLINLRLGDGLEEVRRIYPPAQEWPTAVSPRGHVKRYRVERGWAKRYPRHVQTMHLGFKNGRLVEIQLVYDEDYSRQTPYETLAASYTLEYGPARGRSDDRFWWDDGRSVLRVLAEHVAVLKDGAKADELHTSVQLFEKGLFERVD